MMACGAYGHEPRRATAGLPLARQPARGSTAPCPAEPPPAGAGSRHAHHSDQQHHDRPAATTALTTAALAITSFATVSASAPTDAHAALRTFTSAAVTADGKGYLVTGERGEHYAFGTMRGQVNPVGFTGRITDVSVTADGRGSLAVSSAGQLYASGTARAFLNPVGFSGEIISVAITADGRGALAVSSAGQYYAYGTARPQPNPVGFTGRIVDVALTADGRGAVAVSSAGQYYASGTATGQPNPTGFSGTITGLALRGRPRGAGGEQRRAALRLRDRDAAAEPHRFRRHDRRRRDDRRRTRRDGHLQQRPDLPLRQRRAARNADPGQPDPVPARVADLALRERFTETNGNDCNPYTFAVGARGGRCPAGQSSRQWCADFATTVWQRAGADVRGLTGAAASFRTAAVRAGTWKAGWENAPQPGDAVVYGRNGHVGIVARVEGPRRLLIVEGNAGNRVAQSWIDPFTDVGNGGRVLGYAVPRPR